MAMTCFHHLLGLLKSLSGCVIKKTLEKGAGRPKGVGTSPLSPHGPVRSPALAPPGYHGNQPNHGLSEAHQDESMRKALPGLLDRWGVTALQAQDCIGEEHFG